METLIIIVILIGLFVVIGIARKGKKPFLMKPEEYRRKCEIFNDFKELVSKKFKKDPDQCNSLEWKAVAKALEEKDTDYLEFRDFPDLPYSGEEIFEAICLISESQLKENQKVVNTLFIPLFQLKTKCRDRVLRNHMLREFGGVHAKQTAGSIKDVSKLPYPKQDLLDAFIKEYLCQDEKMKNVFRQMICSLAEYQEGVGDEDLHILGFNILEQDLKNSEEDLDKILQSFEQNKENSERYKKLIGLVEREQKLFHDKMVGSIEEDFNEYN